MKNKISEEFEDFAYLGKVCLVFSGRKTSGHFRKSSENNEIRLRLSEIFGINLFTNSAWQVTVLRKRFFLSHGRQHDLTDHCVITAYSDVHGDTLIECQPGSDQDIVSAPEHPR